METKDLYKNLGLSRGASQEDIRKAHRMLVRQYHPDANPEDPRAEERFKKIQRAYEVLSNEKKRREYDEGLRTSPGGSSGRPRFRESASRPRTRAGERTAGETTHTVDLSELFKLLGEKISRISELLGKDPARLAKLLGENINENTAGREPSAAGNEPREKRVKGPRAQGREKRVKGPSARRRGRSS